jgi:uncharacterized protein YkwD
MKYFITLILIIASTISFSQTKLDSLVFDKLNKYRDSIGLSKLEWDSLAFKPAKSQSLYLSEASTSDRIVCGHTQDKPGYETAVKRYLKLTGRNENKVFFSEVCNFINVNRKDSDTDDYIYNLIANRVIAGFIASPAHNSAITSTKANFAGVSTNFKVEENGFKKGTKYWMMKYSIHTCIVIVN